MSRDRERPVPTSSAAPSRDPDAEAKPVEGPLRSKMESRFGEDFSTVRIHSGPAASESARAVGARAYTVGEDVALGPGHTLDTPAGEALLEHELGHVLEQRHGAPLGVYRAPKDATEARVEESYLLRGAPSYHLDPKLGSLSLGLSTIDDFDFDKATLKDEHGTKIADVVDKLTMLLVRMPTGRISVTGYTDLVGGEASNLRLGLRRAEAVRGALVKGGVPEGAIRVASEGKHTPVVQTAKPEPRNRRVDVRFEGELITPGTGPVLRPPQPPLTLGERPKVEFFPGTLPSVVPPYAQKPAQTPPQQAKPDPKGTEGPPKKGSPGDVVDAITKIPDVARLIDQAKETGTRDLGKLSTGEKVAVGTVTVPLVTGALVGIWSDPAARKTLLDLADGKEIPVPGAPWLKIVPKTAGGAAGGMLKIDVLKIVPGLK
jgi:outer membrane protein OmpA-like peptidoglycan-associated protein